MRNDMKMSRIAYSLKECILPAPLIVKGFVKGEENCCYEKYLTELLSKSSWFKRNHPGPIVYQKEQSRGECDAYIGEYGIDFKLFVSSSYMEAQSVLSHQIVRYDDGITFISGSKRKGSSTAIRLNAAFRDKSMSDLSKIDQANEKQEKEEEIRVALNVLKTNKNLLLFVPFEYSFAQEANVEKSDALLCIAEVLTGDFYEAFRFREREVNVPNLQESLDTFLACVYNEEFILYKVENCRLGLLETVPAEELKTFTHLKYHYTDLF